MFHDFIMCIYFLYNIITQESLNEGIGKKGSCLIVVYLCMAFHISCSGSLKERTCLSGEKKNWLVFSPPHLLQWAWEMMRLVVFLWFNSIISRTTIIWICSPELRLSIFHQQWIKYWKINYILLHQFCRFSEEGYGIPHFTTQPATMVINALIILYPSLHNASLLKVSLLAKFKGYFHS